MEASTTGDWATAKVILDKRPELVRFAINEKCTTALHVAALAEDTKLMEDFVKKSGVSDGKSGLGTSEYQFRHALGLAAAAGKIKMAEIVVNKDINLPSIPGNQGMLPLYVGALYGRHNMGKYIYDASRKLTGSSWTPQHWSWLLRECVKSDFFGVALKIVKYRPELARDASILGVLARKPDAFNRVEQNLIWRIINSIFSIIHMKVAVEPDEKDSDALKLIRIIWRDTIRTMFMDEVANLLRGPPDQTASTDQTDVETNILPESYLLLQKWATPDL